MALFFGEDYSMILGLQLRWQCKANARVLIGPRNEHAILSARPPGTPIMQRVRACWHGTALIFVHLDIRSDC